MDLQKCRYILTVAEQGSFSRAASALFVSQPYLSRVVADIESELEVKIFVRDKGRIYLTKAGKCYIEHVKALLLEEQNLLSDIRGFSMCSKGSITIGIPPANSSYILPNALRDFCKLYPNIELVIEENDNQMLLERTLNTNIDLCFFSLLDYPPDLEFELIKMEPIFLVLPPDNPLGTEEARGNYADPPLFYKRDMEKLKDFPCVILHESKGTGMIARDIFRECGISPKVRFRLMNVETAYRMAGTGIGFTFIPQLIARELDQEKQPFYYKLNLQFKGVYCRSHVAAYRKGRNLSIVEKELIEIVKQYA